MPNNPEEKIAQLAPSWLLPLHKCPMTDPVIEYAVEHGDPALKNQLIATYLETTANAYRSLAEGADKAAKILGGAKNR